MKNIDSVTHVRGESVYVDDIPVRQGTLHAAICGSPAAHGRLINLDVSAAMAHAGVATVLTAAHITGRNQIGSIIEDETLFAEDEVHYQGQPLAMVLATTEAAARAAVHLIQTEIEPLEPVVDAREARARNQLVHPPRTFAIGNMDAAWRACEHIFEGRAVSGGQEHLYIETQGAYAFHTEKGGVKIYSSTQGPTAVQRIAARVLGLPMQQVEVDVTRLGGGFGGKEDQATPWAVMAALGAYVTRKPVKLILHRMDDMRMTGKRNPYDSDFKIGLDQDLNIIAYEATYHQNGGAAADLSPAILERTLFHATNSYHIPNVRATAWPCKTHLPPNTAFRGFGGPQAMFVMESAIARAADSLGVQTSVIQERNLLKEGDSFPYGQVARGCRARQCWDEARERYDTTAMQARVDAFNQQGGHLRKGLSHMPICFGISFTKTALNQAGALVHIYQDGSVGVSTAAVEMGQGVNTKMVQIAAATLGVQAERVSIETTNTTRVANTSPTAASAAADLNGKATQKACLALVSRLKGVAAGMLDLDVVTDITIRDGVFRHGDRTLNWNDVVIQAWLNRISLSEQAHYATPGLHFDPATNKGEPFAYHVYGVAVTEVTLDCLRGTYEIDAVKLVHDYGRSMNPIIDRGQTEGGLVQGIGWMTMEEIDYDANGRLRSNALSTYKVPDIYSAPSVIDIHFLETDGPERAAFRSKAIGEPPLMYGIGAWFAIRDAIRNFKPNAPIAFDAPFTPEKVLMALFPITHDMPEADVVAAATESK